MMLAQAGQRLGMTFRFLDPATEIPARGLGAHHCAAFEDIDALDAFATGLDVVTFEFENVPFDTAHWIAERVPVHPAPEALRVAQDRLLEKTYFAERGIPTPPFAPLYTREEFDAAVHHVGLPAVLKTRRFGYDGKGQRVIRTSAEAEAAWHDLQGVPLILEGFVPFQRELSILAVRGRDGAFAAWPLVVNRHREGILRLSVAPAPDVPAETQATAERHIRRLMDDLSYVGVLAVEFFDHDGRLVANEMAPRVHNSGHWSIEGSQTSQFENHLRAVTGLPLGPTAMACGASAMVNVIGSVPTAVPAWPDAHYHDYGKDPRPGRKLSHLTLCRETPEDLARSLQELHARTGLPD
jgi:5-(carboxyamino)imidazole ribonucleotide synthase